MRLNNRTVWYNQRAADKQVKAIAEQSGKKYLRGKLMQWKMGKGTLIQGPYTETSFQPIGNRKRSGIHWRFR